MATRPLARSCSQLSASSPARAFLQLAPRRHLNSAPPPVLDFLLPRSTGYCSSLANRNISARPRREEKRAFTSSVARRETSTILNPKKDDNGYDMQIDITPRASNRLREIMYQDNNPNLALRILVESGGCHGFQYLMSLTTLPPLGHTPNSTQVQKESPPALNTSSSDPNVIPSTSQSAEAEKEKKESLTEDDTVFMAVDGTGAKVVMDEESLKLLKGSKVDYTMELIGTDCLKITLHR
ncbi:hypothetical protein G7Y89_g9366 [Cudoniella acicularis]|uniref:FeS cluster biogenesis domain-containing protein n=1 Tax=Cudoniella acicularis TaxID=354080 RepID=A0A8H4RII0_9HELO|nr:hypothetical protein G7Y89_g9366 [Cudoniella acicularis]